MYKQIVNLAPGEMLQLDWGKNYRDFSICLNGQLLGSFPDKAALKLGHRFNMPGDREITVILSNQGLEVWHNGTDLLSGLKTGFVDHFKRATQFLIGLGIFELVIGLVVALFFSSNSGKEIGVIAITILAPASILIGLGVWAKMTGSNAPLIIALVLLALTVALTLAKGKLTGVIITGIVIYQLYMGIRTGAVPKQSKARLDQEGPLDAGI